MTACVMVLETLNGQTRCGGWYLLWSSCRLKSAGTDQEGVRMRFAVLHLWIIAQHHMVEQAEEVSVLARLQLERRSGRAGSHRDGDAVLQEVVHELVHTW